jgi:hypothetical protein
VPSKKPNSIYDHDGNFDIELYAIRTTRKSKVPLKVEDPQVLQMVGALLNRGKSTKPKKAPRKVTDVQLPPAPEPTPPADPVDERLQRLEGQMEKILSLLEDKTK